MREDRWNDNRWQRVAEAADTIRAESFAGASVGVVVALEKRLRVVAELARNVDRGGSAVNEQLRDSLTRELRDYRRAQLDGWGAVLLMRWPLSLPARLRLAAGLTEVEWAQIAVQDPHRLKAIRRDVFVSDLLVGPSVASLVLAGRLAGESHHASAPSTGMVLPDL